MEVTPEQTLLDIGSPGQRLRVVIGDALAGFGAEMFPARIEVEAFPFRGHIEATFAADEVDAYTHAVERLRTSSKVRCGGNRATLVQLELEGDVIEVTVMLSEDDPWPTLRYLILPPDDLGAAS
jgi:hypothetical protein